MRKRKAIAHPNAATKAAKASRADGQSTQTAGLPAVPAEVAAPAAVETEESEVSLHTTSDIRHQLRETILDILSKRAAGATCCPSEAPRRLCPSNWRPLMDVTREVARQMAAEGLIEITQRGQVVDSTRTKGPLRLRSVQQTSRE